MKPEVDFVLFTSMMTLAGEVAPKLAGSYEEGSAKTIGMLMALAALEYDRAADVRFADNRDMRDLFNWAGKIVKDSALAGRLQEAAIGADDSFKITDLNKDNDALRQLLIELHVYAEGLDKSEPELLSRIWAVISKDVERRNIVIPAG